MCNGVHLPADPNEAVVNSSIEVARQLSRPTTGDLSERTTPKYSARSFFVTFSGRMKEEKNINQPLTLLALPPLFSTNHYQYVLVLNPLKLRSIHVG